MARILILAECSAILYYYDRLYDNKLGNDGLRVLAHAINATCARRRARLNWAGRPACRTATRNGHAINFPKPCPPPSDARGTAILLFEVVDVRGTTETESGKPARNATEALLRVHGEFQDTARNTTGPICGFQLKMGNVERGGTCE